MLVATANTEPRLGRYLNAVQFLSRLSKYGVSIAVRHLSDVLNRKPERRPVAVFFVF